MPSVALSQSYYRVLAASGLANLADGIRLVAFPLLAFAVSGKATMVAVVFAAGEAPWVVVSWWAGALTDRVDRRRLILIVTVGRVVLLAALASLILVDATPIWLVALAAFVLGTSEVLADNVSGSLVPSLVPAEHLERANSRMIGVTIAGNELVGPAIGGLLFAGAAFLPFLTNAALLAVGLLFLAGLPLLHPIGEPSGPAGRADTLGGVAHLRARPLLRLITWSTMVLAAVDAAWFAVLVVLVDEELRLGPSAYGVLLAIGASGGLAGTAFADRKPDASLTPVALFAFASMAVSLLLLGLVTTPTTTAVALILTSAGFAVWNVYMVSARQRATPNELLGRVAAAHSTVVVLAGLVGALIGGFVADVTSLPTLLLGTGALVAVLTPVVTSRFRSSPRPVDDEVTS